MKPEALTSNPEKKLYGIRVYSYDKLVEITFNPSFVNFETLRKALTEVKHYIGEGYRVKLRGYSGFNTKTVEAFRFALLLLDKTDTIIFEGRSRYKKSERRRLRREAVKLMRRGYSAKRISEELRIPLKTVYRWMKTETRKRDL